MAVGKYFERDPSDPNGLTFTEWQSTSGLQEVVNSCELRAVMFSLPLITGDGLEPHPSMPDAVPLQARRRSGRRAAVVDMPVQATPIMRKMDEAVDREIRSRCHVH